MADTKDALLRILITTKAPLTSTQLADDVGVSSRTVKREMKAVADQLAANGATLVSGNAGYRIEIVDEASFTSFQKRLSAMRPPADDDVQIRQIVSMLLTNDYATQDDLADELFLSRSSIGKIMKHVRIILEKHQIVLSSRPHYGYYLIGQESAIRNFMVSWLFDGQDIYSYDDRTILGRCRNYGEFLRVATRKLIDLGHEESDPRTAGILKYLIATGCRCAHGQHVENAEDRVLYEGISTEPAKKVASIVADYFGTDITPGDIVYLSYLLGNVSANDEGDVKLEASFFEDVVDACIREVKHTYRRDFSDDEDLRRGLISHLYSTCSRMSIDAVLSLPMLAMVKAQYSEAYDYAVMCGRLLFERYGLRSNEDSLGYIAMHFAAAIERQNAKNSFRVIVVCESGYGTSELLRTRIETRFATVRVTKVISRAQLAKEDLSDVTLLISTIPLSDDIKAPHVLVSPLFGDDDVRRVADYLKYFREAQRIRGLFAPELFFPLVDVSTKEEALALICKELIAAGAMREEDKGSIYHREEISSTEINPLVAMPHCLLGEGGTSRYAIFTTTRPIDWEHDDVQLIMPMLISASGGIDRTVFPTLYRLTMDTGKVKRLVGITEFEPFMEELFANPHIEAK